MLFIERAADDEYADNSFHYNWLSRWITGFSIGFSGQGADLPGMVPALHRPLAVGYPSTALPA
jgi:hypothetical protein